MNIPGISPLFAKGDTVYLSDGTKCEYVFSFDQSHVVYIISTRSFDGEIIAEPQIVREIFDAPPIRQRDNTISQLDEMIQRREQRLQQLAHELMSAEAESKRYKSLSRKHEALQLVDAFLERRITHIVSSDDKWKLELFTFDEAFAVDTQWDKGMRLLSLFGKSNGDLQWRLHKYTTEGDSVEVISFFSLEAAAEFCQKKINDAANELVLDKHQYGLSQLSSAVRKINLAKSLSLTFPEFAQKYLTQRNRETFLSRQAKLLEELSSIEAHLKESSS